MKQKHRYFYLTTFTTLLILICNAFGCTKYQAVPIDNRITNSRLSDSTPKACPPSQLISEVRTIAAVTKGPVGAAFLHVERSESASFEGGRYFPTQSVYKFPIAIL